MPTRSSRNLLASVMIVIGAVMIAGSPLNAADDSSACTNVVVNFDDHSGGLPLWRDNPSTGPVAISLAAGTYDILLTSSDPGHAPGKHSDQLHESWFFTLDSGYVSPTTPDFDDEASGVAIVSSGVTLASASQITAFWAGQAPSPDSVHAMVSFTCVTQVIQATSSTSIVTSTSVPPTTASTSVPATTTSTTTTSVLLTPTTIPSVTAAATTTVDSLGGTTEEYTELAFTGTNLNLMLAGISLIVGGLGLVVLGSIHDRRRLAVVTP